MNFGIEKLNIDLVAGDMESELLKLAKKNDDSLFNDAITYLEEAAAKLRKYEKYTGTSNRILAIVDNLKNKGLKKITEEETKFYIESLVDKLRTIGKVSFEKDENDIVNNIDLETKKSKFNISLDNDFEYIIKNINTNDSLRFKPDDYEDAIEFIMNNRENIDEILTRFVDKKEKSKEPVAEIEIDETEYDKDPEDLRREIEELFGKY